MKPIYAWALGSLAVLLFLGAIYAAGANSQKPKIRGLEAKLEAVTKNRDEWKVAAELSEANRQAEARKADTALAEETQRCSGKLDAVRRQEAAKRRIYAKPIVMKDGCAARELVAASEMGLK